MTSRSHSLKKTVTQLILPWGGRIAATTLMNDKRCLKKVSHGIDEREVRSISVPVLHISTSSYPVFLILFFQIFSFLRSTLLTFFPLTSLDVLMSFPSCFLPLITSSYSSFLRDSTSIHHVCLCLSLSWFVPFCLTLTLFPSLYISLSLSLCLLLSRWNWWLQTPK